MYFKMRTTMKRWTLAVLLPCITAACTHMTPGMRADEGYTLTAPDGARITPVIRQITPALLEAEKAAKGKQPQQDISQFFAEPRPYVIGPGDMLSILVWNHPELNVATAAAQALTGFGAQTPGAYVVDQSGMIQFPYVGAIKVAGLTEQQANKLLADGLVSSIKRPDITLRVQSFRSKRVFVDGEVKVPGNQVIDDVPMTLPEALTRAGGVLPTADQSNIVVTRNGSSTQINLPQLVRQGIDPARIMLRHGDVVRVAASSENKVYVLGEVVQPKALQMNNGRLTLTQALGEAGGLNMVSAAAQKVYVVRNVGTTEPIVYNLDAESPIALAVAENFELNPKDVVYVDTAGLARFSRIVGLIIPSANSVAGTYGQVR